MNLVGRHGASLHIFACRPLVWSADYLDAMLRLSPRGEIAPPWRDINERTPCAVKAQSRAAGRKTTRWDLILRRLRSSRGRPEALEGRRMATGTTSLVAVLRDARILRQELRSA